jgi:hypothetical protein
MEAVANSVDDVLIDSLSFKLSNSASYITNRRSVTYYPTGSNIYKTSSGTKVIKFVLTSDDWLDVSTVRLMFNLVNNDSTATKMLRPLSGAWSFFRRIRIMCQGTLIEDFDYNRTHQMFEMLTSGHNRDNDDIEGFGYRSDSVQPGVAHSATTLPGIAGGGASQTVGFKILSGIFNQSKMLPLKYMPITIEFELVSDANDPIVTPGVDSVFTTTNTSNDWQIENVQLKCDVCTLDNALQNNYDSHLLSGKNLPINYNTYITQSQAISGQDVSVNVSRAITRLKSLFISFYKTPGTATAIDKDWLNFVHPMDNSTGLAYNSGYELEYQVQIGSKLYPEYPVRSVSESFAQLKKCLGILGSNFHSVSISPLQYRTDHHVIGVDTEKALQAGFTGLNTRQGDLMTIKVKAQNKSTLTASLMPDTMFVCLHADCILECSDAGVQIFD